MTTTADQAMAEDTNGEGARKPRRGLKRRIDDLLHSRWAPAAVGGLGFAEATFVPFPVEPLVIPIMVTSRRRLVLLTAAMIVGNVIGASATYAFGALLSEGVVDPVVSAMGWTDEYARAAQELRSDGFAFLLIAGLTPFPFQLGPLAAGAVGYAFPMFFAAVALARGLRYCAFALLVYLGGERLERFARRRRGAIFLGGIALFVVMMGVTVVFG